MEVTADSVKRTPRGQGELLRERLVDAALELLSEGNEPESISIRGVTRKAGVSPTAFYLHFDSREALMRALLERGFSDFRLRINEASGRGRTPWDQVINAGISYIEFAREQPERYRLIFAADWADLGVSGDEKDEIEVANAAFTDLVELIAACLGPDHPQSDDLDVLALGVWSGLHGYVTLCHAEPGMAAPTDEQYVSMLAKAWLGA